MNLVLGALAALVLGVVLISNQEGDVLDEIGDWLTDITTSEQDRLDMLEPGTREMVQELVQQARDVDGIDLYIGQTRRTPAQEKALQEAGNTSASLKVSWHELGRAVDLYPKDESGRPDYNADVEVFRAFQSRAVALGFRSLAFNADGSKHLITNSKGKKIWDGGHVEWRDPYGSIAEAVAAEGTDEQKGRIA